MPVSNLYRHKKHGTTYEIITFHASIQCSAAPEFEQQFDDDFWTVYQDTKTRAIYVRPTDEFEDGRFELLEEMK